MNPLQVHTLSSIERSWRIDSSMPTVADIKDVVQQEVPQQSFVAAHQLKVTVKQIAPYAQETDLQIVCFFKHKPNGDTMLSAATKLDQELRGLISSLRNRGEFVGDELETVVLIPPSNGIKAKQLLLIGWGDEGVIPSRGGQSPPHPLTQDW